MIPVLFKKNEQQFRTYGLGEITDIINPKVTRERNGQYLLYFQYPQNAEFSDVFEEDMRIKSDAGVRTKWQTFEISRVIRKEGQLIEVFAKHISQSLLKDALNPSVSIRSSNAQQALRIWNSNRIGDEVFDVWSDITTTSSTNWDIRDVSNAFEALAGVQGSILDVWGGEYEFDNKMIRLHKEMGRKSPVPLEYGRNITGLEQDQQEDNVYTSVYPFATYTPEGSNEPKTVTLPEHYIDGKYLEMHNKRKIQVVDFSGEFEYDDIPAISRLRTLAKQYAETNEVGLLHENLKVEYIDLSKTLDYQDFQTMEEVELNDRLPIFYPKFGITNENAKVVVVNYDPVKEENISIELGVIGQSFRTVTTGGLGSRVDRVEKQQDATNNYIVNAKGNRIWFETPDENMEHKIGDTWFEKNGPYDRIRVWNGNQWEIIIDSEDIDKNVKAIATQQQEIEDAQQTADEAVEQIDTAVANAGFTSLDETISSVQAISNQAQINAGTAIDNALEALSGVNTAMIDARSAVNTADSAISTANEIKGLANDLAGQVSNFEVTVDGFNQVVNNYEGQVSEFRNDVAGYASTVENYEIELDEYGNLVDSYATEVSSMRNTVDGFESTVASYGDEVAGYADDVSRYENQVSTFKNTVDGLNSTVANYEIELDEYGNVVSQYATQVSQFRNSVDGLTSEIATYQEDVQGYEAKVVTLENTVNGFNSTVQRVESDYNDLGETVNTHTTQISNMDGRISAKANQDTVDTLAGTVQSLGTEFDIVAGQVSNRVWKTDIEGAIADIEVGGRNLLLNSDSLVFDSSDQGNRRLTVDNGDYFSITPINNGNIYNIGGFKTSIERIQGETYTFSIEVNTLESMRMYYRPSESYNSVGVPNTNGEWHKLVFTYTQTGGTKRGDVGFLVGFHSMTAGLELKYRNPQIERGTIATDWTPAPEDTDAKINHIETEWTQTFDSFSQTVAGIDGRVSKQEQTVSGMQSVVYDPETGLSSLNTQLADLIQVAVTGEEMTGAISVLENNINARVEKGDVINQINISDESILIQANKIMALGDVVVDGKLTITDEFIAPNAQIDGAKIADATIGSAKIANIDAGKITTGKIQGIEMDMQRGYIGDWTIGAGRIYAPWESGYTIMKADGDVALATQSPNAAGSTTGSKLQIWHNGNLRFGTNEGLIQTNATGQFIIQFHGDRNQIYRNISNEMQMTSQSHLTLYPSFSVRVRGDSIRPHGNGSAHCGMADYRWNGVYVNSVGVNQSSDIRLKNNVRTIKDSLLDYIGELKPIEYEGENGETSFGYSAQDYLGVLSKYAYKELGMRSSEVLSTFNSIDKADSYLGINYKEVEILKGAYRDKRINENTGKIVRVEDEVTQLKNRIKKLEEQLNAS